MLEGDQLGWGVPVIDVSYRTNSNITDEGRGAHSSRHLAEMIHIAFHSMKLIWRPCRMIS